MRAMAFGIREAGYPAEWVYLDDGTPTCRAFEKS